MLGLRFSDELLASGTGSISWHLSSLVESLRHFRFTGDIEGMLDGSIAFLNEPILQSAPLTGRFVGTFDWCSLTRRVWPLGPLDSCRLRKQEGVRFWRPSSSGLPSCAALGASSIGGCSGTSMDQPVGHKSRS